MAHRSVPRETALVSALEAEGRGEFLKHRVARRGRSATPGLASLWEENRHLYMDNLRLWDCLTLVRSDPTMTCQSAIKLVFSLNDDDYFRMFPDTRQLMLLTFPGGVVFHSSSEEARIENIRLKDENARLHAAVWVLRDNPSFQADSTVAAIFRLDEAQFQSKFHTANVGTIDPGLVSTSSKARYQNNNREKKKKTFRTSLDLGHEQKMAIRLTNCPIKIGGLACDTQCSQASRHQRSQSMIHPSCHSQNSNGSSSHHQDFTSNWKPSTSPMDQHGLGGTIITSEESHLKTDWAILCWRQNYYLRPVDLYALEGAQSFKRSHGDSSAENSSQKPASTGDGQERQLRRSNTISREDDLFAERMSKGPTHMTPTKCVSFAEPLPSYQADASTAAEFICLKDRVNMILDASPDFICPPLNGERILNNCPGASGEADAYDHLKKTGSNSDTTNIANCNKRNRKLDAQSKVYTLACVREPSKRCLRDTATSPVLDTRTCVVILGRTDRSKMASSCATPRSSASDDNILNKSNNNDESAVAVPPLCCDSRVDGNYAKIIQRPLSPKHRDLRQARMKNMLSLKKLNKATVKQASQKEVSCITNNALNQGKPNVSRPSTHGSSDISREILKNGQPGQDLEEMEDEEMESEYTSELESGDKLQSGHAFPITRVSVTPQIVFSEKPGMSRRTKHTPYSLAPFTTVKQFLDRHQHIQQDLPVFTPLISQLDITKEEAPTTFKLSIKKSSTVKVQTEAADSSADLDVPTSSISGRDEFEFSSQHQLLSKKHKGKWNRSESLLWASTSSSGSNPRLENNARGKIKLCDEQDSKTTEGLKQLAKLGKHMYTKPLVVMLTRNGGYLREDTREALGLNRQVMSQVRNTPSDVSKVQLLPTGPFITFVPKQ